MAWRRGERLIEDRREQISTDPRATRQALLADLKDNDLMPRDRARLLGLVAVCEKYLGRRKEFEATIAEARAVPRAGKIARLEVMGHETEALIDWALQDKSEGAWQAALVNAVVFLQKTQQLPRVKAKTSWGKRQDRIRASLRVAALLNRGQIELFIGSMDLALTFAVMAGQELSPSPKTGPVPKLTGRMVKGVVSLMGTTLVRGGQGKALRKGVEVIEALIESFPENDKLWRNTFSALLGCVAIREGRHEDGARIFQKALEGLAEIGAKSNYSTVIAMWEASIKQAGGQQRVIEEYLANRRLRVTDLG